MSEARDRLIETASQRLAQSAMGGADSFAWGHLYIEPARVSLRAFFAHPADLIAVLLESLTCETCEGSGAEPPGFVPPDGGAPDPCSQCGGTGRDPVKVQAVLRPFAEAGVLTEKHRGLGSFFDFDEEHSTPLPDEHGYHCFVSPWVPKGAPE